jgi:hypothetical protein
MLLGGCVYVNERGLSIYRYNDCKEQYDSMGFYRKECPKNVIDYGDIQSGIKSIGY